MATATGGAQNDLRGGSIGLADVLFQAITYMAPGVGLAFSIGIAVPISGATLPLSVVVALVACTFAAIGIGQLARHIPSAGGLYTYSAKGIGPRSGFLIGWFYLGFALTLPSSLALLGGWFMNSFLSGKGLDVEWWIWAALLMGAMFLLTFFDVRMSAKATIILGVIELVVLFALAVTMVASEPNSTIPFTPSEGVNGWSGIFQGAVFAILAFIGFEAASALGEEAKNPRRTVQIGVIGSCVLVGLFYVFQTYAWNIGAKLDIVQYNIDSGNSDWTAFGEEYWGNIGGWILFLALVNSIIACGTAATNNAARVLFSMGRAGALPSVFAKTHPKYKSPYVGVIAIVVFGYILDLIINQIYGDPLTGFFLSATFFTVLAILIYILSCTACIGFFNRKPEGRPHRNFLLHTAAPVLGILAFILPLYTQYFNLSVLFSDSTFFQWAYKNEDGSNIYWASTSPASSAVMYALTFTILGIIVAFILKAVKPSALMNAARAFGGEATDEGDHAHSRSISG